MTTPAAAATEAPGADAPNGEAPAGENAEAAAAETPEGQPANDETGGAPGENDNAEAPEKPEAPAAEAKHEKPLSAQAADLVRRAAIAERKERRAEERERTVSQREREIEARLKDLTEGDEIQLLERAAKARGVDFATVVRRAVQRMANNGELAPEEAAKQKDEQVTKELADLRQWKQAQEERLAREEQQRAVSGWQNETVAAVRASADSLPFLARLPDNAVAHRAAAVAGEYYRKTGELPERTDLLQYLEAQRKTEVQSSANSQLEELRLLGLIPAASAASSGPGNPQTGAQDTGPAKAASRTLTNDGAAQRPANGGGRQMTDRERLEYAAAALGSR